MLTRPDIADEQVATLLLEGYGLGSASVEFLPIGADPDSANFRVTSGGTSYFLKLRRADFDGTSADIAVLLHARGITEVVAPIATRAGASSFRALGADWLLYPFIDAPSGFEAPLSRAQWTALGSALRAVHASTLPPDLAARLPREDFAPRWRNAASEIDRRVAHEVTPPAAAGLVAFWTARRDEIREIIDRAEELAAIVRGRPRDLVLCHADLHAGNVLVPPDGGIGIVDWDEPVLAPRERDLMFVGAGIGGVWNRPDEVARFFEGYGPVEVDPTALAYYRYERIVTDLALYGAAILDGTDSIEDQAVGLRHATAQFLPDNVVEQAQYAYAAIAKTP